MERGEIDEGEHGEEEEEEEEEEKEEEGETEVVEWCAKISVSAFPAYLRINAGLQSFPVVEIESGENIELKVRCPLSYIGK